MALHPVSADPFVERELTQPRDDSSLPLVRLLMLVTSLLAGVATALAVMPIVFRNTPTDISRIGVLLDALRDSDESPEVMVFGNSIVMSGIDAVQLGSELPARPLAWNLASTGQSLAESAMITRELPASARIAIYATPLRPDVRKVPLHSQKGNAYYLYGFRPSDETLQMLSGIHGAEGRSANAVLSGALARRGPGSKAFGSPFVGVWRCLRGDRSLTRRTCGPVA